MDVAWPERLARMIPGAGAATGGVAVAALVLAVFVWLRFVRIGSSMWQRLLLGTLMRDIERLDPGVAAAAAHAPRLESLAVRFEASHPGLAEALRQLIDALGKAGI